MGSWAKGVARDSWAQGRAWRMLGKLFLSGDPISLSSCFPFQLVIEVVIIHQPVWSKWKKLFPSVPQNVASELRHGWTRSVIKSLTAAPQADYARESHPTWEYDLGGSFPWFSSSLHSLSRDRWNLKGREERKVDPEEGLPVPGPGARVSVSHSCWQILRVPTGNWWSLSSLFKRALAGWSWRLAGASWLWWDPYFPVIYYQRK